MGEGGCCPPTAWHPWGLPITASVDDSVEERTRLSNIPAMLPVKVLCSRDLRGEPAPSQPLFPGLPSDGKLTPSIQSWHSLK